VTVVLWGPIDASPDLLKLCGAKGIRTPDLLDANESNWVFVKPSCVDYAEKPLAMALGVMVDAIEAFQRLAATRPRYVRIRVSVPDTIEAGSSVPQR